MALIPTATKHAPNGMVCTIDHLASGAGVALLRAGGSAVDAAVGANAVLAVTSQHVCGMGGDLFALVHEGNGPPVALNASGRSGSGADAAALRAEGHRTVPRLDDVRAVTVPGCVDGWLSLHERFGRLPLADVLEPARRYAQDGFPATPTLAASVRAVAHLPEAGDYTQAGPLRTGMVVRRPGVARALGDVAAGGRDAFYGGEFGQGLVEVGRGLFTEADLARVQADWVDAVGLRAWDRDVWTVPPNSQGYLVPSSTWIAAGLPLPSDAADPRWVHLLVEAARQAAFDRPDVLHEHADGDALLAEARLAPRRAAIDDGAATLGGEYAGGGTTYLCAVDRDRMGVSLIQSNASGFGSNVVVPGVRIFLQNRALGFSLEPGHAAEYGPGKRPPHTLAPALTTHPDGSLDRVIGTMGGDSQPQVLLQLLARMLAGGESVAAALAAGRWRLRSAAAGDGFDTWRERGRVVVELEGQAPETWDEGLRERGHTVERAASFSHEFGHAQCIVAHGDVLAGATDPRPIVGACEGY